MVNTDSSQVNVLAIPDNGFVVNGVLNTKQVLFDIITPPKVQEEGEEKQRPPLNLCVVLDRSGSMASNDKLTFAKEAIVSLLTLLKDDDVFHLVTYESKVQVVLENVYARTREELFPQVKAITHAGCTNLSEGLKKGSELVEKHQRPGYTNRMFLFSDGLANEGIQDKKELFKFVKEIHNKTSLKIDSFGIGADFDSQMMKGIAEHGQAEFFYLESATVIPPLVLKALDGITESLGSDAHLTIRGRNGAIVTKISGTEDPANGVSLGNLHYDNSRRFLCELNVPGTGGSEKGKETSEGSVTYLHFDLSYVPVGKSEELKMKLQPEGKSEQEIDFNSIRVTISGDVSFQCTEDASLVKEVNPRVKVYSAIQKAVEMDKQILAFVNGNNLPEAVKLQNEQIELLKSFEKEEDQLVQLLIGIAEQSLKKLQERGDRKEEMAQEYSHKMYMKSHGSARYCEYYS